MACWMSPAQPADADGWMLSWSRAPLESLRPEARPYDSPGLRACSRPTAPSPWSTEPQILNGDSFQDCLSGQASGRSLTRHAAAPATWPCGEGQTSLCWPSKKPPRARSVSACQTTMQWTQGPRMLDRAYSKDALVRRPVEVCHRACDLGLVAPLPQADDVQGLCVCLGRPQAVHCHLAREQPHCHQLSGAGDAYAGGSRPASAFCYSL